MLLSLAARLHRRPIDRYAFFLLATLVTILIMGYHFGTFDQFAHIPYLKKFADPALFPNDGFIGLRHESYSYFWRAFVPLRQLTPGSDTLLQWTLLAGHFAVTYLTFVMFWGLSWDLFQNPLAALLSTLAFIVPHLGFAGFPQFEFSLLNRTFALPFALWAIRLYLQGRPGRAFLLAGLLFNIHVITVVFVLIGFFSGIFMGWVKGRSDADNDIQEFREAIEHGSVAVVVQTDTRVKGIADEMKKRHAHAVYVTKHVNPMPVFQPEALALAH